MTTGITVAGLGSGDADQMTLGVWKLLQQGIPVYVRTATHPVVRMLADQGIAYTSFDSLYEQYDAFPDVYEAIVQALLAAYREHGALIYAVPGHPMVAEATVRMLTDVCGVEQVPLAMTGGESFLDQAFLRLGVDPVQGFQLLDAAELDISFIQPKLHTFITQVYDRQTAGDVKLTLMDLYPDEFPVVVAHALGIPGQERIDNVPLYEIDRLDGYGNHTMIWVPRTEEDRVLNRRFERLREIVQILRSPGGCPWDREQTHDSIRGNLVEETYEVLEAIEDDDPQAMCEELGDLLMQVLLHAVMEEETGTFTITDIVAGLNEKLIRRHPHVFGERQAGNAEEALRNWQAIKAEEKRRKGIDPDELSLLAGVPRGLPALSKAWEYQKRAAKVGFDWSKLEDVLDKVSEELNELREAADLGADRKKEELGDLLFAVVNAARFLKADPEEALSASNRKFKTRFGHIEQELKKAGRTFAESTLEEMENWWQDAKK